LFLQAIQDFLANRAALSTVAHGETIVHGTTDLKTIWTSVSSLCNDHLNHVSEATPSPEKLLGLQTRVCTLYSRRNDTLAAHRDLYIYEDLEQEHFRDVTITDLHVYQLNYEPNILDSIKRAKANSGRNLIRYFGFTRTVDNASSSPRSIRSMHAGDLSNELEET
jgi:hypothetical protein